MRSEPGVAMREGALLLCCARASRSPENESQIGRLIEQGVDWRLLLQLARVHGMMPLLYWHLQNSTASIPGPVLKALREYFLANSRRNLLFAAELREVLGLFARNGIPAVPYKGPVLAATAYGSISLREFSDLDVLVPKSQARAASDLLLARGYGRRVQFTSPSRDDAFLDAECQFWQVRPDVDIAVEIHWDISPPYMAIPMDLVAMSQRLVPVSFAGMTVTTFSPDDLLQILCVHGAKHAWARLEWICSIAELTRLPIDWPRVVHEAERAGLRRMLFLGLGLARDLLGAQLPYEVATRIDSDRAVTSLARKVGRRLFRTGSDAANVFGQSSFDLQMRERLRDKIRYTLRRTIRPAQADWQFIDLPRPLRFLYYGIRPVRLAARHGAGAMKRIS